MFPSVVGCRTVVQQRVDEYWERMQAFVNDMTPVVPRLSFREVRSIRIHSCVTWLFDCFCCVCPCGWRLLRALSPCLPALFLGLGGDPEPLHWGGLEGGSIDPGPLLWSHLGWGAVDPDSLHRGHLRGGSRCR